MNSFNPTKLLSNEKRVGQAMGAGHASYQAIQKVANHMISALFRDSIANLIFKLKL